MSKKWPHLIKAVIFDNDGTILDTEPIYAMVHEKITGQHLDWDMRRKVMGRTASDTAKIVVDALKLPYSYEEYLEIRNKALHEYFLDCDFCPGAKKLIEDLKKKNIPMAVATSSNRSNFETKLHKHKNFFESHFLHITTGDDIENGKPNPEIFLTSMKKFGIKSPENVLVFEDAPSGVKGANNAGMPVVMIPDKDMPVQESLDEIGAKPTVILKSLENFNFDDFTWESK